MGKQNEKVRQSKALCITFLKNMDLIRAGAKRFHIFPGKLKSRWIDPFIIHQVHLNGVVELLNSNNIDTFKVNGHRLKPFMEPFNQDKEEINLLEPQKS
ncbi:hypothetical protein CK203_040349 [Vitis vinifera]|uniref:Uncharacterized protein n=1 Tax=Vitis vinifera TaxID=29760 RepID=A0A438FX14_VITVI|nr:hypothetical protein CK203_040349 [Vitis vinifera]